MIDEKMKRFLNSIQINNVDAYDMSFEMVNRNRFNRDQWDMVILKDTPWTLSLIKEFREKLFNISYPYTIKFSYRNRISPENVINLFYDWYLDLYKVTSPLSFKLSDNYIDLTYRNEAEKQKFYLIIDDFKDLLTFLNYDFVIREKILDLIDISEEEMMKIRESAKEAANIVIEESKEEQEVTDRNDAIELQKKESEEISEKLKKGLIELMQENKRAMEIERERARLNKRGQYKPVDSISSINENSGNVDFDGTIFSVEERDLPKITKVIIGVADANGNAIYLDKIEDNIINKDFVEKLTKGTNIRVRGAAYFDDYTKDLLVRVHYIDLLPPDEIKKDKEPRVELHLHSNMSAMDAVTSMEEYCAYAEKLGHKAMAITDHAVLQAYPDAQNAAKTHNIKMIYGCEFYMVDDKLRIVRNPSKTPLINGKYVILDLETTGLSCKYDAITEFGAVKINNGLEVATMDILINPERHIPDKIQEKTNITDDMVKDKPTIKDIIGKIVDFCEDAILVTHNADFDISFLQQNLKILGKPQLTNPVIDTLAMSQYMFPNAKSHNLGSTCKCVDVSYNEEEAHRADYDARVLGQAFMAMMAQLNKQSPLSTHEDLGKLEFKKEDINHLRPSHIVALAKNKEGLKALYTLVSISHLDYLSDTPRIPSSIVEKYRENLLIGSACFEGEVFRTARYYAEEELKRVMSFYDYIEVQPLANYSYLVNIGDISQEQLIVYVKDIIKYAGEINKTVCATGDVHYLTPKEKIFRDVYIHTISKKEATDADGNVIGGKESPSRHPYNPFFREKLPMFENPDQHYRSGEEMLECFKDLLGEEKAHEIVIDNPNKIADMVEAIIPLPNDKLYTPKIDNCDTLLKDIVYKKAKEIYGDPLPEAIATRLEKEFKGIFGFGNQVIYYISHLLVKKANDDGYIVGSRGSVGSSLVATMASITEVNPMPPHYICPHCHHLEWTSKTMPEYASGYDLPDKLCPECGHKMNHDGQNIPFETFLGFNGDKVPDIDLNFARDYQARAHDYTKVVFGEGNVYRAGTISAVESKTAFGYAKGFLEKDLMRKEKITLDRAKERVNNYPKANIAYLASGCTGVKKTTGQHPGGIVVIPKEYDVFDFTPLQYPANNEEAAWKTTHFDFNSVHDTILKLDLLGHLDPMALRMMCNLSGVNLHDIPLNDPKVFSLFTSNEALKMDGDYLGVGLGTLGIPEFGTEFVRGILRSTKPKCFSDLVIISGLSHGTKVWQGNAEDLINKGVANLKEVIGCRDDIMTYLIGKGLEPLTAFTIMEKVRKGKGLNEEFEMAMRAHNVPKYYIDSCNKIAYMFPKGHAVAYVLMAIRVGYFKIYYPLEYYATWFSLRAKEYDIEAMIKGKEAIINRLNEFKGKSLKGKGDKKLSPKEAHQNDTLYIALEMVQRGFKFANIDLYKSDAENFVIDYENKTLIPPFITIDGLGEANAASVREAIETGGPFMSKEDLLRRTRLTQTNVDFLDKMGVLDNLRDTDQLSLFD